MSHFSHVFSPLKFGNVEVKNRIELGPACHMLASHDGYVTREMVAYYQNLARGGAGIITVGESPIDGGYAKSHEFQLNLGDDKVINGLSVLAEAVHRYGAKLSIEVNHSGRFTLNNRDTIGPSPIPTDLEEMLAKQQGRPRFRVIEMVRNSASWTCTIHGGLSPFCSFLPQTSLSVHLTGSRGYGRSSESRYTPFPAITLRRCP